MNIHNPKYLTWWQGTSHMKNAKGYNLKWDEFRTANSNPSVEQILKEGKRIMSGYGISVNF